MGEGSMGKKQPMTREAASRIQSSQDKTRSTDGFKQRAQRAAEANAKGAAKKP